MSGEGFRFIATYHHHLLQISDCFQPPLLQPRESMVSREQNVHGEHHRC